MKAVLTLDNGGEDCRRHLAPLDWKNPQTTLSRRIRTLVCRGV